MANRTLTALVGFHDEGLLESTVALFGMYDYSVTGVKTIEEYLQKVREGPYDLYYMDVNLGKFGSSNPSASVEVWGLVKERVEKEEAKFMAVTGNPEAISKAIERGIPKENLAEKRQFSLASFLKGQGLKHR